ncbi:MAG: hypothetical protein IPN34_17205 [Planctomycetes bacterium]|nr:hypothetical protein [Planctomycetota bacterium]
MVEHRRQRGSRPAEQPCQRAQGDIVSRGDILQRPAAELLHGGDDRGGVRYRVPIECAEVGARARGRAPGAQKIGGGPSGVARDLAKAQQEVVVLLRSLAPARLAGRILQVGGAWLVPQPCM